MEVKDEYLMDFEAKRVDTTQLGPILLHLKNRKIDSCDNFLNFVETVAVKRKQFVLPDVEVH